MENRVRIAMEANRRYVQDGLDRRKLESKLDAFEDAMIRRCDEKYEAAYWKNIARSDRENCMARIAERAERREKAEKTRKDVALACLIFFAFTVVMLQLATWTPLPVWTSLILIGFGVLFLVSFIRDPRGFPKD